MAERTITQAEGLGLIAAGLLALALIVAAVFIFTGLTTPPPPAGGETTSSAPEQPPLAGAPAAEAPAAN